MSVIDIIIVAVYLLLMLGIGAFVGSKNKTQEDYFLAGRSMSALPVALSVAATMISANSFIGGPGWAYTSGLLPFMQNITVPLACFLAVTITVPIFYYLKVSSIYEYIGMRLGKWSRLLAVAQFFINSLIQVSSMVFIPALIIQMATGWSMNIIVPLIVFCTIIYTVSGGIKAVIWTDVIQMIIVWGGILIILVSAVKYSGVGLGEMIAQASAAGKYNAFDFSFDITKTNAFLCSCFSIFMWTRYFCFDQTQMQRILSSKSMKGIKKSFVTSSIFMNITYFLMLFIGTMFFVIYKGKKFTTSNEIMIQFILHKLPVGVTGLIIAAVFASAMSSVDSLLNSMTTAFTKDIYEQYIAKDKGKTLSLKQTILLSCVLGVLIIFVVFLGFDGTVKSVIDVVGRYVSYFSGPALGVFLLAMLTVKANDKGVSIGFLIGLLLGYIISKKYAISWLVTPAIGAVITIVFGYLLSHIFSPQHDENITSQYTAMGIKEKMLREGREREDGVKIIPFSMDKYGIALLGIFLIQYVMLIIIR